ncbi:MAG: mannose-1-phosphate guanylyltransferase/mannose-6-phosphate isomerase, partial [Candidatus Omnitrophica bacterium]|nr:mannose-1-phosphate guanylyltransferase/mannose-6-phosphate isomerase [Candidatus Omnitrophota bacterium]
MKYLILAGGKGERLWPLSRKHFPKQFLSLTNTDKSLLRLSVERISEFAKADDIYIICPGEYRFFVADELEKINPKLTRNIIIEPSARNTAAAIILGVRFLLDKICIDLAETICVLPADHLIFPKELLFKYIKQSDNLAREGYVVTFGVPPKSAHTGYGYINIGKNINKTSYQVKRFTEKPNLAAAKEFLQKGSYFWNSGIFAFSGQTIIREYKKSLRGAPSTSLRVNSGDEASGLAARQAISIIDNYTSIQKNFSQLPKLSIDYAVIEKVSRLAMVLLEGISWHDLGSWDSVFEVLKKDKEGNVKVGKVNSFDVKDSLLFSKDRLLVASGLKDQLVVDTRDALFVGKRGRSQKIKDITKYLKDKNIKEANESVTIYRPWGSYTILEESPNYKIKKIIIKAKKRLSLQYHQKRSEHWV